MHERSHKHALRIALTYAGAAAAWILLSDIVVSFLVTGSLREGEGFVLPSIAKGMAFVLVTSALLFALVRRAIDHIQKAENRMQLLFDGVNDSVYVSVLNEDGSLGRFLDVNAAAIRRLGYTRQEFLSLSPLDITRPRLHSRYATLGQRLLTEGHAVMETVEIAKDGTEYSVEVSTQVSNVGGVRTAFSVVRDVTERKRTERERRETLLVAERDKRRFYRETILAVTGGKFELGEPEDAAMWTRNPEMHRTFSSYEELRPVRQDVVDWCQANGLPESQAAEFKVAVGEAITNAVKHAAGGAVMAGKMPDSVWVAIVDRGTGIDTFSLPKVALMPGFTTKVSLGMGYTLMLDICDRVRLATGPAGTTLVLVKFLQRVQEVEALLHEHGDIA